MRLRFILFSLPFLLWVGMASSESSSFLWPATVTVSALAGWGLARVSGPDAPGRFLSVFLLPVLGALALRVSEEVDPELAAPLLGRLACLHVAVAMGVFAFVRYAVEPAE